MLPANASTGRVTGRFIVGVQDGLDVDDEPDYVAAQGTITFVSAAPYLQNPGAVDGPVTMLQTPIRGALDSEGYLCTLRSDGSLGARGVRLLATDDPDLMTVDWTWTATYSFTTVNGVTPSLPSTTFFVATGSTRDLTTLIEVPNAPGSSQTQMEAAVEAAESAAISAAASASDAVALADGAMAETSANRSAAEAAQTGAETARDASVAARTGSEGARDASVVAKDAAVAAQGQAESARDTIIAADYVPSSEKGVASGVATLGTDGLVPAAQLPGNAGPSAFYTPLTEVVVVSSDAPQELKDQAGTYVLVATGTNDGVLINAAIDMAAALPSRNDTSPAGAAQLGTVHLTGGNFNITDPIKMRSGVRLTGSGWLTELRAVNCVAVGLVILNAGADHMVMVDNMWLNGNYDLGGNSSAIYFDMTGSTDADVSKYPPSNPDSYHTLQDLYIRAFDGPGRNGIVLYALDWTAAQRGWMIDRVQIREIGQHGIWVNESSDGFISNVHVGTVGGDGFNIQPGNIKMVNSKAFYCDGWGLYWESGFGVITGFESQDNLKGVWINSRDVAVAGMVIDGCQDEGLYISQDRVTVTGLTVGKNASRYATMTNGVRIEADCWNVIVIGSVADNITNRVVGTFNDGSFVRISGDYTVFAVG